AKPSPSIVSLSSRSSARAGAASARAHAEGAANAARSSSARGARGGSALAPPLVMRTSAQRKRAVDESQVAKKPTTVAEVMTVCPHTIGSDQKLAKAHQIMRELGIRHLPVLRGGKLV